MKNKPFIFLALIFISLHTLSQNASNIKSKIDNLNKTDTINIRKLFGDIKTILEKNPNEAKPLVNTFYEKANTLEAKVYSHLLKGQMFYLENSDSAKSYFNTATKLAAQSKQNVLIAFSASACGTISVIEGKWDSALSYFTKALNLVINQKNPKQIANLYNNIGLVFEHTKQYDKATAYLMLANKFYKNTDDLNGIGICYRKLGHIQFNQYKFDLAKKYYDTAFTYFVKNQDIPGTASIYIKFGDILFEKYKNYKAALAYYYKAQQLYREQHLVSEEIFTSEAIAEASFNLGDIETAKKELNQAIDIAKKTKFAYKIPRLYAQMYSLFLQKKDYKNALTYYTLSNQYKDSMYSIELQTKINDIEAKYQTAQKDKELLHNKLDIEQKQALLQSQHKKIVSTGIILGISLVLLIVLFYFIQKQKKLNRQLHELNQFKNKVFSIISHDLRAPVASIINSQNVDDKTKEKASSALHILDNLLQWSYPQLNKENLAMELLVLQELIEHTLQENEYHIKEKYITTQVSINENFTFTGNKHTMYIIFRNIIVNALKYAPTNSTVSITQTEKKINISNYFTQQTQESGAGTGIGLHICSELAQKNNASLSFKTENNIATAVLWVS